MVAEDALAQVQGRPLPEETKRHLDEANSKVSASSITTLFTQPALSRIRLIATKGILSPQEMTATYQALAEVEYAQPDYIRTVQAIPNDTYYPTMWNLTKVKMPEAWDLTKGTNQITVGVVDTGIAQTHPDFQGRSFIPGRDFAMCNVISTYDGSCIIAKTCPNEQQGYCDNDPSDDHGHGTHVAGTIGAVTNNAKGISGINWNVALLPVKVLNSNSQGLISWVTKGITFAADSGAKVINLSLGGPPSCSQDPATQDAINYARSRGAVVIVSAGNEATDASNTSPASCQGVITVAATGPNDEAASYTNYGSVVDLAAPGGNPIGNTCAAETCITSLWIYNQYAYDAGTSQAAPHVSGAAALLLSINPNLSPDQIENILKNPNYVDLISPAPSKPIGAGRLNVFKALSSLTSPPTPTPTPTPTTTPIPGDLNNDGHVDISDLRQLLSSFTRIFNYNTVVRNFGKT
jgi:serine protease